jgi:hypothetical protein
MMTDIMSLVKVYNEMSTDELKMTYERIKNEIAHAYHDLSTTVIFDNKVDYDRWGTINNLISVLSERTTAIEMIMNHRDS